jgi:hypothetical protein
MKKIEAYKMDDGTLFEDYTQARIHQEALKHMPEINAFISSSACKYNNGAHKKIVENSILAWIFWKEDGANK